MDPDIWKKTCVFLVFACAITQSMLHTLSVSFVLYRDVMERAVGVDEVTGAVHGADRHRDGALGSGRNI